MANKRPVWFSDDRNVAYTTTNRGDLVSVDYADRHWLEAYSWSASGSRFKYTTTWAGTAPRTLHRLLLPHAKVVDHVDRNGFNNRRSNLRAACARSNGANVPCRADSKSGFRGVRFDPRVGRGWYARYGVNIANRVFVICTRHASRREAAAAADAIEREFQPEFMLWRTTPPEADAAYTKFTAKNLARIKYVKGLLVRCKTNSSLPKPASTGGSKRVVKQKSSASTRRQAA